MNHPASPVQSIRWDGQSAVVGVAGDIDLNSSTVFQQKLLDLLAQGPKKIVLDLHAVPYMDSSGVASLVKLLSRSRKVGAAVFLTGLTDRTRSLLEITRLDTVFDIRATVQEALSEP